MRPMSSARKTACARATVFPESASQSWSLISRFICRWPGVAIGCAEAGATREQAGGRAAAAVVVGPRVIAAVDPVLDIPILNVHDVDVLEEFAGFIELISPDMQHRE